MGLSLALFGSLFTNLKFRFAGTGFDCGVFKCMYAAFISKDYPLVFSQSYVAQYRERIALSILNEEGSGSILNKEIPSIDPCLTTDEYRPRVATLGPG
jgi:hypothetical protein